MEKYRFDNMHDSYIHLHLILLKQTVETSVRTAVSRRLHVKIRRNN